MILETVLSRRPSACTFAVPSQNCQIQAVRQPTFFYLLFIPFHSLLLSARLLGLPLRRAFLQRELKPFAIF